MTERFSILGAVKVPLDSFGDHKLFKATGGNNSDMNEVLIKITLCVSTTGI